MNIAQFIMAAIVVGIVAIPVCYYLRQAVRRFWARQHAATLAARVVDYIEALRAIPVLPADYLEQLHTVDPDGLQLWFIVARMPPVVVLCEGAADADARRQLLDAVRQHDGFLREVSRIFSNIPRAAGQAWMSEFDMHDCYWRWLARRIVPLLDA